MKYLFALLLAALPLCASAANVYIRDGGTGDGSAWNNALDQIPSTLTRGNTYYVADGAYTAPTLDDAESGTTLITIKKATVADHGTETGWDNAYGDGVATFTGTWLIYTDDWTIDGQVGGGPGSWTSGHGFQLNGGFVINPSYNPIHTWTSGAGDDVTISHVKVVGAGDASSGDDAFAWSYADRLSVSYCWTYDTDNCPFQSFQSTDMTIQYNYIDWFAAGGDPEVHGEIWSCDNQDGNVINATFRYNVVRWCHSTGGLMFAGTDCYVYGNVFYREVDYVPGQDWVGNHGVIGGWNNSASQWRDILVYNNTFINVSESAPRPLGALGPSGGTSGNDATNNLFISCGTEGYGLFTTTLTNTWSGTDPFVTLDVTSANFAKLDANTSAGTDLGSPYNVDMYGNTRTTWTRGATEYNGSPPSGSGATVSGTTSVTGTLTLP